ncbi:MAG TPA: rRNA maturation RNase YbeY [Caulobacteraceae bacterium]|nr:rRNA maturation RNase YbeY [Caulobacteraceae bacterium]
MSRAPAIEVVIEEPAWRTAEPRVRALVRAAALATLKAERCDAGSVAILLAADARLRALNASFRGKDAATNVLSFPGAGDHLGDIALALGVCAREAAEQGKSLADHLQHLTAHGVLHLLGYDHEIDAEAEAMEAKERLILAGLGIADPYAA